MKATLWTDLFQGNIGYAMPVLHPMYGLPDAREGDSPRE